MTGHAYSEEWYDLINPGGHRSALAVLPTVYALIRPSTAVDVGCGRGSWATVLAGLGCAVTGVERSAETITAPSVEPAEFDLELLAREPGPALGRFNLAVCLEVAEHIPAGCADGLVAWLCELAPIVLFSAATPGQGGEGHVNEQWPDYWVSRFAANGYAVSGALRWRWWNDPAVECWYSQNLLVAAADPERLPELFESALAEPWSVVHPRVASAIMAAHS